MKKILLWGGLGLALVLAAGFLGKNFILRKGIEAGAKWVTGMNLEIEKLRLGVFTSNLRMQGVSLLNPAGYEDKKMLHFPEIYGKLSILRLLIGKLYLSDARLNIGDVLVVKNKNGEVNLLQIKGLSSSKEKEPEESGAFYIQRLELSVGKVVYKDYSHGEEPKTHVFDVGIEKEVYHDIKNPQVFLGLVLHRALVKTAVAKLINWDMGEIQSLAESVIYDSEKMAEKGAAAVGQQSKEVWDATKKKTGETTEQIKDFFRGE